MSNDDWQCALDWVNIEHRMYQTEKWSTEGDDAKTPDEWMESIAMYLHRAKTLGLDNPLGRQAVGKAAATAAGFLETVFRVHGSVPAPGFPSGELRGEFKS